MSVVARCAGDSRCVGCANIAYDSLQRALARKPASRIDGYMPEQRFFLSYATIWRSKYRTEALIDQPRTGNHSPSRYRVLGPLATVPAFARLQLRAGRPMMRAVSEQISIW